MVKKLYVYGGKTRYFDLGEGMFRSSIVFEKINGNYKYFVRTPEGKVEVYSKGKNKLVMKDGVFFISKYMKPATQKNLSRYL